MSGDKSLESSGRQTLFSKTSTIETPEWADPKRSLGKGLPKQVRNQMLVARQSAKLSQAPTTADFSFAELFAGVGGFHQGLKALGGHCVYANEWDRFAAATYWTWTGRSVDLTDIRDVNLSSIPRHDVLCAGFPCQPFSLAGVSKKNSLGRSHGFDDTHQGNLFFSVIETAKAKRPKILFLENVRNLLSHDCGNTIRVILEELDKANYWYHFKVVDSSQWVPQRRKRVFFVCFDKHVYRWEDIRDFQFPEPQSSGPVLSSILDEDADPKYTISDHLWQYLRDYKDRHAAKGSGFGFSLFSGQDVARTISARYHKDGAEILIDQGEKVNPRRLSPREACLLMGFTDELATNFGFSNGFPQVVSDTQAYRQFGNSVCPLVVRAIGESIRNLL